MALFTAAVLLLVFCGKANAYIDPGSGSYMLQMSLAAVLAVVFSIRLFWQRLKESVTARVRSRVRTEGRHRA